MPTCCVYRAPKEKIISAPKQLKGSETVDARPPTLESYRHL